MQALITIGCMIDHGGMIVLGDSSFLVEGKAVHLDGMTHYCPKCRVQSRVIASNQGFNREHHKKSLKLLGYVERILRDFLLNPYDKYLLPKS